MASKIQRVLLVDDEPDFLEMLASRFRSAGFDVLEASNGRLAFDLASREDIDLIVSDVRMPGGDGIELMHRVAALVPNPPPVILVTGYVDDTSEELIAEGAAALLAKPFPWKDLLSAVREVLPLPTPSKP